MPDDKQDLPSLPEQGKNLAKFTFEVVQDTVSLTSNPLVPKNEYKERLKICSTCEHFILKNKRCKKCGCYMESKARFSIAKCPIQKW
jgi:recombinational DNA repair protein RecR